VLPYAARAVPIPRVALAGGLVVVLLELVRWQPWTLWPLEGIAVGLLAGATAWCFDEDAAAVTDTAPRGLAWQAAARAPALLLLLAGWTAAVLHAGNGALFGHRDAVLLQGLAGMAVSAALGVLLRGRGQATPGLHIATVVLPVCTAWALVRPWSRQVPVFPYGDGSSAGWSASTTGWLAAAAVALVVLAATGRGRRRRGRAAAVVVVRRRRPEDPQPPTRLQGAKALSTPRSAGRSSGK
jgi:hypothetical protein